LLLHTCVLVQGALELVDGGCCGCCAAVLCWRCCAAGWQGGGCCGAAGRLLRVRRVQQHLVVVEELAERVGLVVEEGLLLRRQLGAVRVEQVLEARRAREDVAVKACGATAHGAWHGRGWYAYRECPPRG